MSLPYMSDKSIMRPTVRTSFGGLNHNLSAQDGEIYDMLNMSSREYPLLTPRPLRGLVRTLSDPNGADAFDDEWWVDFNGFYFNGVLKGKVSNTQKEFALIGRKVIIMPDKLYYDIDTDHFGVMGDGRSLDGLRFEDGEYAGVPADANTIYKSGANWGLVFSAGDAVSISGCVKNANNGTFIIREISGDYLRFYENTFDTGDTWHHEVTTALPEAYYQFDIRETTYYFRAAVPAGVTLNFNAGTERLTYIYNGAMNDIPLISGLIAGELEFTQNGAVWECAVTEALVTGYYKFTINLTDYYFRAAVPAGVTLVFSTSPDSLSYLYNGTMNYLPLVSGAPTATELTFALYIEESGTVTITRDVPNLDHICVNENRLWGCSGNTIYASKLGDPFNFNVFDGLASDSWAVDASDSAGEFTGCVSYRGYPIFFKEEMIYKIQGDNPQNFAWVPCAYWGVKKNCSRSIAVAGETLFYLSRVGVCAYTGGQPSVISGPLGVNTVWIVGVGGTDGLRYYVCLTEEVSNVSTVYVYDTRYRCWHKESNTAINCFYFYDGGLYMIRNHTGEVFRVDGSIGTLESGMSWEVKFADSDNFYETTDTNSQNKKGPLRLLIRATLANHTTIDVKIKYDDGSTKTVGTLTGTSSEKKKSYIIPLILRRCDHYRLSLEGTGDAVIYSISVERYSGSQFQGSSSVSLPNQDY